MDKEMLFKNTSKLDDKEIASFQTFAMKKVNLTASILFTTVFVAIGIGVSFIQIIYGLISLACGVIGGFVLLPYLMKESLKKHNEKNFDGRKYLNTYAFFDEYVTITSEQAMPGSNEYKEIASKNLEYIDIYQVVLRDDHLYLYLDSYQAFILDYKGMTKGTATELIALLKEKCFKVINKITK